MSGDFEIEPKSTRETTSGLAKPRPLTGHCIVDKRVCIAPLSSMSEQDTRRRDQQYVAMLVDTHLVVVGLRQSLLLKHALSQSPCLIILRASSSSPLSLAKALLYCGWSCTPGAKVMMQAVPKPRRNQSVTGEQRASFRRARVRAGSG